MNLISDIKDILSGEKRISDRKKYSILAVSVACVHFSLIFVFRHIGSLPMIIYNCFSVVGYLYCLRLIKKNALGIVYAYICLEVPIHSILAIYTAGWDYGFAMYLIAIVPVGFEMSFALKDNNRGIKLSVLSGTVNAALFFACRMYSYSHAPLYVSDDELFVQLAYLFNSLGTFLLLIVYSCIFTYEITAAQTSLKQKNAELAKIASTDALTGFYNRRKMHEYLYKAAERNETFSIIMSDIDNFKKINDTYGHDCGDEALRTVSDAFRDCMSDGDRICRWGGEEFLVLANCSAEAASEIAEKIRSTVEGRHVKYNGYDIKITLTLGVSEYNPESTVDKAITAADKKLYIGKNSGKNRVVK